MKSISLNGTWLYRIGNGADTQVTVPFSHLPVGRSECNRTFDLTETAMRYFLKFDGITYFATVYLNGKKLGDMLPYCEYTFEITDVVRPQSNQLQVVLEDIDRAFGPSEGWENFGGIIRDVSLLLGNAYHLRDVFFKPTLCEGLQNANFEVAVTTDAPDSAQIEIVLRYGEKVLLSYMQGVKDTVCQHLEGVHLWSPDSPALYTLDVTLLCNGLPLDTYQSNVGFRELTHDRHRFLLNGKPLFLKGVCKHEMVADSGHCPTVEQMEQDLRIIKRMGCNFVRLVHYPHNKKILDLADRIGLMVSEEPGLWWSDTSVPEIAEGSKEVLRRTILRDRNHVCIAFWLCFNECRFTERYLIESAKVCRQYDPTRMVSGANCMSCEDTLVYYNKCGFDFYTMHPYAQTFDKAQRSAEILYDKPLLFTEWGGYFVYDNPHLVFDFLKEMHRLYLQNSDSGALAGAFIWFFAELYDFNRGEPACTDGVLHEGLVDQNRNPTLIYDAFCRGMRLFEEPKERKSAFWFIPDKSYEPFDDCNNLLPTPSEYPALLERMRADAQIKGCKRKRVIANGPRLVDQKTLSNTPFHLSKDHALTIAYKAKANTLTVIGLTSPIGGYPLGGRYGEDICRLTVRYHDGSSQVLMLQNGVHVTTAYMINGSSRINPIAEKSARFATFGYDKNFEQYLLNRLDVKLQSNKTLIGVELTAENDAYAPLIYGLFVK